MTELRVAIFTGNYNHIRDGVSLTLNRLVKFLEKKGIPVLVFGPTVDEPDLEHNGELVPVPSIAMPGRPEYRISIGFPESAQKSLGEFAPSLIHIATPDILGFRAMRYARANNIQIVSSYHTHFTSYLKYYNLGMLEFLGWKYLAWFYSRCEHVYVPSSSMAEELDARGINKGIRLWERGVNTDQFSPQKRGNRWRQSIGVNESDIIVSFVSRLVWEKDLQTYVETIRRLQDSGVGVKALVVGDGPAREELQTMLPEAHFTGFITGEDLARAYASSDIFLFPSDTETFGNVTLEAMSSALPCVVADATGSKSLVEPGINGFLVPPRNTVEFARSVRKIAEDGELRRSMGEAARQKALAYSWNNVNEKLLQNYYEALGGPVPDLKF